MVKLVDTQDLKSCALLSVRVQVPPLVQKPRGNTRFFVLIPFKFGLYLFKWALRKLGLTRESFYPRPPKD